MNIGLRSFMKIKAQNIEIFKDKIDLGNFHMIKI